MRRFLKEQLLETVNIMLEAHGDVASLLEVGKNAEAAEILVDCQQGAISVGNALDDAPIVHPIVHLLEEYCESVYQLHEKILEGTADIALELLDATLNKVLQGIKDLPTTREIVFLPYKASMWDSLESVWKKFSADDAYEAVVIPIPYFDKNPDGTFRRMHYEALQYPSYVPVTSYESYDIEANHPDAIYIHNPYDEYKYVTTVHPDYYSSKLKDYTDELVYIPYFVLDEVDPENAAAVEGMRHFVTVPGCLNADKIIVQSEDMKKVYVNVLSEWTNSPKEYWERKVEGTGSPKIDRVENLMESDYVLPSSWERLIAKEDGTKKKVIFYNTGIAALLESDSEMLDKIERNFQIFQENGDDVTLLWRPHPLIEATLTSMRPHLWERYKRIVSKYKEDHWGIYDDSADLDRAIAVSDAYYGDASSVVQLYKKTGKPIMIQNVYV